jgi:hypothetical protein
MSHSSQYVYRVALVCAAVIPFALLSGCALTSSGPADSMISEVSGVVHGGQSPIEGATVTLYVTSPSAAGYGQAATVIGTGSTSATGGFTISPSANATNCPAGQQAYITSAGGYQSGSPLLVNSSVLLMAALGNCNGVSSSTFVSINEVTTVAAAYALSGFMTTSASSGLFQANVSAPTANSAATGSITAAAGLPHAFLNAASLASFAAGTANSQTANITVGTATVNGVVPANEINTLGDILQGCVNGATGNSVCTNLFADTPSISGAAPANTLQAMINLARNPASVAAMNATTGLFSLISGTPAFANPLTAAPPDWSLAIVYTGTALPGQYFIALDANDTAYAGASGSANLAALSAYGTSTPAFTAGTVGTATRQIAPDALGNVWVTGYKTSSTTTNIYQYSAASGGAPTAHAIAASSSEVYGVAVDQGNNVWVANAAAVTPNITELQYSASYGANYTATVPGSIEPVALTIDANQNVWAAPYYTSSGTYTTPSDAVVLPNLTPGSAATYASSGTTVTPVYTAFASNAIKPLGLVIDASGNAWYSIVGTTSAVNTVATTGVEEVIPSSLSSASTSLAAQSLVANSTLGAYAVGIPGIDGAGTIYLSDNLSSTELTPLGIHVYSTVAVPGNTSQVLSPPSGYLGCYLATSSSTTCGTFSSESYASAVYNPREIVIDSTGSVWAGITTGGFTQFIGLGAPSWPLLQTGKPGFSPGNTAATPLP